MVEIVLQLSQASAAFGRPRPGSSSPTVNTRVFPNISRSGSRPWSCLARAPANTGLQKLPLPDDRFHTCSRYFLSALVYAIVVGRCLVLVRGGIRRPTVEAGGALSSITRIGSRVVPTGHTPIMRNPPAALPSSIGQAVAKHPHYEK